MADEKQSDGDRDYSDHVARHVCPDNAGEIPVVESGSTGYLGRGITETRYHWYLTALSSGKNPVISVRIRHCPFCGVRLNAQPPKKTDLDLRADMADPDPLF